MRKGLIGILLLVCLGLHAETYTIVFRSGNGDSSSEAKQYEAILSSATDNIVTGASMSKIYRAKAGYGIKGGTASAKGTLSLQLDATYHPSTLTVYAAAYGSDNTTTKGISVCGHTVNWTAPTNDLQPYTVQLDAVTGIQAITIEALAAKNNRFYIQKIEFSCDDPQPSMPKISAPYQLAFGSSALIDSLGAEEVETLPIAIRNATDSAQLRLAIGRAFALSNHHIAPIGADVDIQFTAQRANTYADTLIVTAQGIGGSITRRIPISASAYIYTPSTTTIDSSSMRISITPGDYYVQADNLADSLLKSALGTLINSGIRYRYGSGSMHTWDAFYRTDREESSMLVMDMYSNEERYFNAERPTASVPDFDIEHMFPKSWWGGNVNDAYQDLFHLVPADYSANRSKSNHAPGFVADTTFFNGSFATGSNADYPVTRVFCPEDEYKGDFARAYFYIATCYGDTLEWVKEAGSEPALAMTNTDYHEFLPWLQDVLLAWHRMDPVSEKEITRAIQVNAIQGNRNPFIDYPELVEFIWGNRQGEIVHFSDLTCTINSTETTIEQVANDAARAERRWQNGQFVIIRNGVRYSVLGAIISD